MSQEARRLKVLSLLVALVVLGGGLLIWRLAAPGGRPAVRLNDDETERRRVAAFDPTYDPGRPTGSLAGVVKDAEGQPVDGAVVAVTRQRGKDELPTLSRPIPRTTVTSGGGRFQLAEVIPGQYGVTATAAAGSPARLAKVAVESGQSTEVTLTLGRGGFLLTGEVSDVGGGPIVGAKAMLRALGFFTRPGEEPAIYQVSAGKGGVFEVRLATGEYDLTVKAEGYAPARDRLNLSTDQSRRYRLNPAARLSGRVLDRQSREPVADAAVWLRLDRLESFVDRDTTSDSEGRFQFDDLAAGGYVVLARSQQSIGLAQSVSVGVAHSVTDVEVLVERGRSIRGVALTDDEKPLANVRVAAGRSDPPYERPVFARSGADGKFSLEGLLPAKYRLSAWAEGRGASRPEVVQVAGKDLEGVKLRIAQGVSLRGQVVDGSGQAVVEAIVTGSVETPPPRRFSVDRATTDAAGKFELQRLIAGKLTLTARHPEHGNTKLGPEDMETVARNPALVLRLSTAASISGLVKYEDGTPVARAIVMLQPTTPTVMFGPPEQAFTDETGRYRLGGLDPGKFLVIARRENTINLPPASRQEVTVAVGEQKTGVDLLVPPGGKRIAGKVVSPDGKPVSGAQVTLGFERMGLAFRQPIREGGGPSVPHTVSDQDGGFVLEDLQEGTYTLWASDSTHADGEQKGVVAGSGSVTIRLQAGSTVAGVVRTADGKPVSDYTIAALPGGQAASSPDERMRNQMTARTWSPSAQVHDPQGSFLIGRLAPGAYELSVTTADGQGAVQPVTVAAGEKKQGLSLVIQPSIKLEGRVQEMETLRPLPFVEVQVMSATTRLEGQTRGDGSFAIEGVPPGRARLDFRVGTSLDGTHVSEHLEVDVKGGEPRLYLGIIKLMKGNYREKFGDQMSSRGRIGFTPALVEGRPSVTGVRPGLPAEKAGMKDGDLLLRIDGRATDGLGNGALDFLAAGKVDKPLVVVVQPRAGGEPREVTIQRVPLDYDPARPNAPKAAPATAAAGRSPAPTR